MSDRDFSSLPIEPAQLDNLASLGFAHMTPVQAQALPHILAGADLIAQAKTGSGKTAAFGIGLLQQINPRFFGVQALVLCPTRELADQVSKELRRLARCIPNIKLVILVGGKPFGPQRDSLTHGAHIAVGTPGRVQDHLQRGSLELAGLKTLVLDEADRMLDMGFVDAMKAVIAHTPKNRQTLLFSATYPAEILAISRAFQRRPVSVSISDQHASDVIEPIFYQVKKHERNNTLLALFEHYRPSAALVFCHTRKQCDEVAEWLRQNHIDARAIHGDLDQRQRDQVLAQFANGSCPVLVATDVAARGLDIKALPAVINFELPRDPETYVHRIGRTGRAGERGVALSLFLESEQVRLNAIQALLGKPCICDWPGSLDRQPGYSLEAEMVTIEIDAGRKQKIRPGDVLGAFTRDAGLDARDIGKIEIFDQSTLVAVRRSALRTALNSMANGKLKGRSVRSRRLG